MITAIQNAPPTSTLQTMPVIASQDSFPVSQGAGAAKMVNMVIFFLEIFLRLTVLPVDARFAAGGILELSVPGLAKGCGLCSKSFHVVRIQRDTCALADQCGNVHFLKIFWRRERHAGGASWPSDDAPRRCTPAAGAESHRHAIINGVWASWHDLMRFLIVAQLTGDSRDTTKTVAPALRRAQDRPGSCPCRGPFFRFHGVHRTLNVRRARELRLVVSSPGLHNVAADAIVSLYAQRMKIEQSFRDTKNTRLGLGLEIARSRSGPRFEMLLLLAQLASFVQRLTGEQAHHQQLVLQYMATRRTSRTVISVLTLGRRILNAAPHEVAKFTRWNAIPPLTIQALFACRAAEG